MNKEEYLKYLEQIKLNYDAEYVNECSDEFCLAMRGCIKKIEELINEYFEPKPYKFKDLKVGMWVWVKKINGYFKINSIVDLTEENNKKYVDFGFGYIEFKDNMFYRKEVKE